MWISFDWATMTTTKWIHLIKPGMVGSQQRQGYTDHRFLLANNQQATTTMLIQEGTECQPFVWRPLVFTTALSVSSPVGVNVNLAEQLSALNKCVADQCNNERTRSQIESKFCHRISSCNNFLWDSASFAEQLSHMCFALECVTHNSPNLFAIVKRNRPFPRPVTVGK